MALLSNITVDLPGGTVFLNSTVSGGSVETITYDTSSNQITFDSRGDIIIDFSEFLPFCDQVNILQTAILFNYGSINTFTTFPYEQLIINELHDIGLGMWNLTVSPITGSNVVEYQGTKSSTKLEMIKRTDNVTLSFPEWLYFLQALNHYRLSIKGF